MIKNRIVSLLLVFSLVKGFAGEITLSLDEYLTTNDVTDQQNSGHIITSPQYDEKAQYFTALLEMRTDIKNIVEIGFCLGHSSDVFLSARPDITVLSFDMMYHWFNDVGRHYIDMKYPDRHLLIRGDSLERVPAYTEQNQQQVFDLILIDGGHEYHVALNDIINMQHLAGPHTIVIMDDTDYEPVNRAWQECVQNGLVEELERRSDCALGWTVGRYVK